MSAQRARQVASQGEDISVLARSIEKVLRNLVRLLVGKLTLTRVQAILREVFVEEAEKKLKRERPGKNVPLSQLALITGLDTRTLVRVRGDISRRQDQPGKRVEIGELSPEARVIEMWLLKAPYVDPVSGNPRDLTYGSAGSEFEALVKEVVTSRGVTVQSILERLLATNSVAADRESGLLTLLTERYSPFDSEDEVGLMSNGLQAIVNMTGTIDRNVRSAHDDRVIQREVWTFRLDEGRRVEFRDAVRKFLLKVENEAATLMEPMESDYQTEGQTTAGVGFYYFEEDQ
jgi:hypothetical protein